MNLQEQPNVEIKDSLPRGDLLLSQEELALKNENSYTDKANEYALENRTKLYSMSAQERADSKINTSSKGWSKYWKPRLAAELDILPKEVAEIVKNWITTKEQPKKEAESILSYYINRRVEVLNFQIKKRDEMAKLKKEFQEIDAKREVAEKSDSYREVFYRAEDGKMFVIENGAEKEISWGDIVADGAWGIKYQPNKSFPDNIWRKMRKLVAVKDTRRNIEAIFNEELSRIEGVCLPTSSWSLDFLKKHSTEGVVAERMAENFLRRLQYNNPEFGLKVESSNALEDADLKYDFKVSLPNKYRGVAVEGDEMDRETYVEYKKKLGVQFTTRLDPEGLQHKAEQIEIAKKAARDQKFSRFIKKPVDDIVLISLSFGNFKRYFWKWQNNQRPSGGPEQYFTKEEKIALLRKVCENALNLTDTDIKNLKL